MPEVDVTAWLIGPIVLPLVTALGMFVVGRRWCAPIGLAVAAAVLATTLAVTWQVSQFGAITYPLGNWQAPLGIVLRADGLSCVMLLMSAGVGLFVSGYAAGYFAVPTADGHPHHELPELFWPLWMFLWSALNGLFLSGDIFNLYVTLELLTLAAIGLIVQAGTRTAVEASLRYLLAALAGSLLYLAGVALLYAAYGTLDIASLGRQAEVENSSRAALMMVMLGLMLKTALFPFHFWLPPAHGSAPAPVSAMLSGLVVKGSFYILLRLWFDLFPPAIVEPLAMLPAGLGVAAILWGSLQALLTPRLKMLVAYSTVAQIGYLFLVFGLVRPGSSDGSAGWTGCVLFAVSHACAKSTLFLATGTLMRAAGHDRIKDLASVARQLPVTFFAIAVAAVSLMGLPPTGAFIAKWMLLSSAFAGGHLGLAIVIVLGGLLSAAYLFRVLGAGFVQASESEVVTPLSPVPRVLELITLGLALVSLMLGLVSAPVIELLQVGSPWSVAVVPEAMP